MPRFNSQIKDAAHPVALGLLITLLIVLLIAGGASRADVLGQVITRAAAWAILIAFLIVARPPPFRSAAPVAFFLLAAVILVILQLVPLPPSIWTSLPGRDLLTQAASASGQEQPWRPLSISRGATVNALSSLIVPATALLLMASISLTEQWRVATVLLALIVASSLLGLLQFSGMRFDHPLVNNVAWTVSSTFANRNHFALFVAIGCLLAPIWTFGDGQRAQWKIPFAGILLLLFVLIILATGSRTGMAIGAVATVIGLLSVRGEIAAVLRRLPRTVSIGIVVSGVTLAGAVIVISEMTGRAVSLERMVALDFAQDLRGQALPTILAMIGHYFPFGSGVGTFDPVYRIHEPDDLLNIAYFNHAHNDFLEIALDAGLAGVVLLGAAIAWWFWKSVGAWRGSARQSSLARLGSGILLLIFIASATDYPARTPMIMAVVVIAAVWLNGGWRANAIQPHSSKHRSPS